jgi:hypothetical protein
MDRRREMTLVRTEQSKRNTTAASATEDAAAKQISIDDGAVLWCHSTRLGTEKSDG